MSATCTGCVHVYFTGTKQGNDMTRLSMYTCVFMSHFYAFVNACVCLCLPVCVPCVHVHGCAFVHFSSCADVFVCVLYCAKVG